MARYGRFAAGRSELPGRPRWAQRVRLVGQVRAPHILLSLLLVLPGCTVKRPQVPIFDLTVSISVVDDTTTIRDIAAGRDFLRIDPDGLLGLDFAREIDERAEVGNRLQAIPEPARYRTPIGSIAIPEQEVPPVWLPGDRLSGRELPESDSAVSVPAFDFETRSDVTLEGLTRLEIEEGDLEVSVHSGLPMPVSLRLVLIDAGNGDSRVDEIDLGRILPGEAGGWGLQS